MVPDREFSPGAGLEDAAVVVVMTVGDVGAGQGKTPMCEVVVDLAVEQEHRLEVRHSAVGTIELPDAITVSERPRGTQTCVDAVFDLQDKLVPEVVEVTRVSRLKVDIQTGVGVGDLHVPQPAVKAVLCGTLDTESIHTLLILCMIGSAGIIRHIHPVDDVASPTMVQFGIEREFADVIERMLVGRSEGCRPRFLGLERGVAELVASIVIEVGERRQAERAVGIGIERNAAAKGVTEIGADRPMVDKRGVVYTSGSERGRELPDVKSLLGEIGDVEPIVVAEVGRMDILIARLDAEGCFTD